MAKDNPLKLAKLFAELEKTRKAALETSKEIWAHFRAGTLPDLNNFITITEDLDDKTKTEGSRSVGFLSLNLVLQLSKKVNEMNLEIKELRRQLLEISNESSVRDSAGHQTDKG